MPFDLSDYEPVEDRLREFWERHPAGKVTTQLLDSKDGRYIVYASLYRGDELREDKPASTGLAAEQITERGINATSALEVCETSAIGRALANLGFAAKGKRPSREEMGKVTRSGAEGSETLSRPSAPEMSSTGERVNGTELDTSVEGNTSGGGTKGTGEGPEVSPPDDKRPPHMHKWGDTFTDSTGKIHHAIKDWKICACGAGIQESKLKVATS